MGALGGWSSGKRDITTRLLSWCSEKLQAAGKRVWVLIWDNASWHISREVREWIASRNREVKNSGQGVRIIVCLLPIKSPWLNAIEPKWIHGKRKVIEPGGLFVDGPRVGRARLRGFWLSSLRTSIHCRECCLIVH